MNCPKCGNENENEAKFCKHCGTPLNSVSKATTKTTDKNKMIIIALIAVVAILAVGVLFAGGLFKSDVPLEKKDFEVFEMDVPVGSEFVATSSLPSYGNIGGFVVLENGGDYSKEVSSIMVSTIQGSSHPSETSLDRTEGDIKVFKDNTGHELYYIQREVDGYEFSIIGKDDQAIIKMLKSVKITDKTALASQSTSSSSSTTQSSPSSPSSISILGGSFSTGSAESDKTYARINVGTAHAGENVIVQIWYSRDGNTLNHGNMVPASVHSDGYLEIASADAYHYYPDHATINIYDTNSHLLTSKSVNLSPSSGTQTF